jgi:hypothetical protein
VHGVTKRKNFAVKHEGREDGEVRKVGYLNASRIYSSVPFSGIK